MPYKEGFMCKNKTLIIALILILWAIAKGQELTFSIHDTLEEGSLFIISNQPEGRTLNSICAFHKADTAAFYAVGDSGILVKLVQRPRSGYPQAWQDLRIETRTLDRNLNLTGVWFANENLGWCVGYRNNGSDTGAIWKTVDGGQNWSRFNPEALRRLFPIPTRFLNIHGFSDRYIWVSCANGYILRTTDGGENWRLPTNPKPGGPDDFSYFRR